MHAACNSGRSQGISFGPQPSRSYWPWPLVPRHRRSVQDDLQADGTLRRESELRGRSRHHQQGATTFFASHKLDEALSAYLQERLVTRRGMGVPSNFRGLDSASRLFRGSTGDPFPVTPYGASGCRRYLCRPIRKIYREVFRYAEVEGTTALSVHRILIARLRERGADEDRQVWCWASASAGR